MELEIRSYCRTCTESILGRWKGWPHRDSVPLLPSLTDEPCAACGQLIKVDSVTIAWLNVHSRYSTGLPDYWVLSIDGGVRAWGHPYYAEAPCPRCGSRAIVSEMKSSNGERELRCNCSTCGVRRLPQ